MARQQKKYTQELRERAVRMLFESEDRYGSRWEANIPPAELEAMYYARQESTTKEVGLN